MADESSNNMLTFVLIFMLGFFFSKLMPDICRSMNKVGIIDAVPNPSNGIIQGFNVGGQRCGSNRERFTVGGAGAGHVNNDGPPNFKDRFTVGGQNHSGIGGGGKASQPPPTEKGTTM